MSLQGKSIVVTRAPHQAGELARLLQSAGAEVILYPCIDIVPPDDTDFLDDALRKLDTFDWLILTSQNTVYALEKRLTFLGISPEWGHLKIAAVGASTAESVREKFGVTVDLMPETQTAEALAEALKSSPRGRTFLPHSARAGDDLAERLTQMNFKVTAVTAYDNVIGQGGADVPTLLDAGRIDAITFTSASTVERFAERLLPHNVPVNVPVVCIGASTAEAAERQDYQMVIVPEVVGLREMVAALMRHIGETRK